MENPYELPRLLARFKLQVRRLLNQAVDLEKLVQDPEYARVRLAEIEDVADDEELLVTLLRLRTLLSPVAAAPEPEAEALAESSPARASARDYRFGARAW
ncbi:hypothetical protein [Azovibrio restrictus]|uniref:hypothetical protein n=1 Tax=Azovibrio restrictus TaxID=146938 RepID=UPI0026E94565|nr:hypothetical protein [Azovibrio restrictus]MDD3482326.1 hypothetical protein [Azovibrio restrictus]